MQKMILKSDLLDTVEKQRLEKMRKKRKKKFEKKMQQYYKQIFESYEHIQHNLMCCIC